MSEKKKRLVLSYGVFFPFSCMLSYTLDLY